MPQTMCMLLFVGVVFNLTDAHCMAMSKFTEHLQVRTRAGVGRGLELGGTFKTSSFKLSQASNDDVTHKRLVLSVRISRTALGIGRVAQNMGAK